MPGGRGSLEQITDKYIELAERVDGSNLDKSAKDVVLGKLGDIIAASIVQDYELEFYEDYKK
jgi:hypothetical protein